MVAGGTPHWEMGYDDDCTISEFCRWRSGIGAVWQAFPRVCRLYGRHPGRARTRGPVRRARADEPDGTRADRGCPSGRYTPRGCWPPRLRLADGRCLPRVRAFLRRPNRAFGWLGPVAVPMAPLSPAVRGKLHRRVKD